MKSFTQNLFRFSRAITPFTRKERDNGSVCEIDSFESYAAGYQSLALLLGKPDQRMPTGETELIRTLLERRKFPAGSLSLSDSLFLAAVVSILEPKRVLEIGTASGFSSALIAAIICHRSGGAVEGCVDTLDVRSRYFADEDLPIGCEIASLIPEFPQAVRMHAAREADFVAQLAGREELEMVFIDANHQHPCPLLDLLRVTPQVRPGGWIVLHDIILGTLGLKATTNGTTLNYDAPFGAELLFNNWTFNKISGGNIGALQLPRKKKAIVKIAKKLMQFPFEVAWQSDCRLRRELQQCFAMQ